MDNLSDFYRRKIKNWYKNQQDEDKAIDRIIAQRKKIIDLLRSTNRDGIENVIQYLDDSGFYYRASSVRGHHNFPGGLAEHCYGTYLLATAKNAGKLPEDQVIIAALLHDICKSDRFWFKGRSIRKHTPKCEMDGRHSVRSIVIIKDCGLILTENERLAIRWHMKGPKYHSRNGGKEADHSKAIKNPLWNFVFYSDKEDAKAHPGRPIKAKLQPSIKM